jgi:hypothetical protein
LEVKGWEYRAMATAVKKIAKIIFLARNSIIYFSPTI